MDIATDLVAPRESFPRLNAELGIDLIVQRDDLLPFPFAGNKVRKIVAELSNLNTRPSTVITNGGIDSNHCRTLAFIGARQGFQVHLILHSDVELNSHRSRSLKMLTSLGATYNIVHPGEIRDAIILEAGKYESLGSEVHIISGGCHTPAGAISYRDVGIRVFNEVKPDIVYVASGTGATQGGLAAAAEIASAKARVIGVSVARTTSQGTIAIAEAAKWSGGSGGNIEFLDEFRSGGYGKSDLVTQNAVDLGWRHGLPLDTTYTGKAFAAVVSHARAGLLTDKRVLFWHTGGLWNAI